MLDIALKIENVSKLYRLGEVGTGTISHDLNRWFAKIRGKEDPFAKVGEVNDRTSKSNSKEGYVWALKDIDFEVKKGEVLGIIGKNGAGKSTLLKLLSKITAPTTGSIKAKGRIASLLEVGTGMHPEMTGRENVYLNGTILGMTKREIDSKFEEIMDFAGCSKYADTPVKRYSSGMKVRLGFAVAAFLEPEILIVDEVLAVGDAEFQKKAIGKMKEVSEGGGRTVLFVSHNMAAVKSLCKSGLLLKNGAVKATGTAEDIVKEYLNDNLNKRSYNANKIKLCQTEGLIVKDIKIVGSENGIFSGNAITFEIHYSCSKKFISPAFVMKIKDENELEILRLSTFPISGYEIENLFENGVLRLTIPQVPMVKGLYSVDLAFARPNVEFYFNVEDVASFEVEGADVYNSGVELDRSRGLIWVNHVWRHEIA